MITREELADLRPGDVVELTDTRYPGVVTSGPLRDDAGELLLGAFTVRAFDGLPAHPRQRTLTVVSRAPRPLYVNHPRTEPVAGDVVRDADDDTGDQRTWMLDAGGHVRTPWRCGFIGGSYTRGDLPARLRLLVDGETGQAVP